jgi:hypothetical protein
MRVTFAHLCDYATVSKEGKLSVLGIFSTISVSQIPARHAQMFLAFELELEPLELNHDFNIEIRCRDADGGPVFAIQGTMNLEGQAKPGQKPRIGQTVQLTNTEFRRPGDYDVTIQISGRVEATVPFSVIERQKDDPPPQIGNRPPNG